MNLAYNLRPQSLKEFIGQEYLVGQGKLIRKMIENQNLFSKIPLQILKNKISFRKSFGGFRKTKTFF